MTSTPRDAGIPLLTEIIDPVTPPAAADSTLPATSAVPSSLNVQRRADATAPPPSAANAAKPLFPTRSTHAPAVRLPTLQTAEEAEVEAIATWTPEQWNRMELALRERILRQILLHVDAVLDAKVRDALADVLQASVTRLADDLRDSLRVSLSATIERAVEQEISRLRNSK